MSYCRGNCNQGRDPCGLGCEEEYEEWRSFDWTSLAALAVMMVTVAFVLASLFSLAVGFLPVAR